MNPMAANMLQKLRLHPATFHCLQRKHKQYKLSLKNRRPRAKPRPFWYYELLALVKT
jgi:hypothetical protein